MSFFYLPYSFYITFGMVWFLSILNIFRLDNPFLKRSLTLLPFIFAQVFLGTAFSRLWFIQFPIIIPISLYIFKKQFSKRIIINLLLLAVFLLILHIIAVYHLIEALGNTFSVYNRISPESYAYMIFLEVLSEIFVIFILFYKLITISKKKNKEVLI